MDGESDQQISILNHEKSFFGWFLDKRLDDGKKAFLWKLVVIHIDGSLDLEKSA